MNATPKKPDGTCKWTFGLETRTSKDVLCCWPDASIFITPSRALSGTTDWYTVLEGLAATPAVSARYVWYTLADLYGHEQALVTASRKLRLLGDGLGC